MPDQSMSSETAQRSWLRRCAAWWLRPWVVIAGIIVFVIVGAPFAYRGYCIAQVPLVDEPFDTRPILEYAIPDEENALRDFERAEAAFLEHADTDESVKVQLEQVLRDGWGSASPATRKWLESNQTAITYWQRAVSQHELQVFRFSNKDWSDRWLNGAINELDTVGLGRVNCFEATRLQAEGNSRDACNSLLSNLRADCLIRGEFSGWQSDPDKALLTSTFPWIIRWAQSTEVDARELRRALDDVHHIQELCAGLNVKRLQVLYIAWSRVLKTREYAELDDAKLFFKGQPQVDLRLLRHLFASLLPEAAKRRPDRPRPAGVCGLFEPNASHSIAHATTSEFDRMALNSWAVKDASNLCRLLDYGDLLDMDHQLVRVMLGLELYQREHGEYPERLEQLAPDIKAIELEDLFAPPKTLLRYERSDSSLKVWSLGLNGTDDSGDISGNVPGDIGFELRR